LVTLLGPIILASIFIIPIYISHINEEQTSIGVVDETGFIYKGLQSNATAKYTLLYLPIDSAKSCLIKKNMMLSYIYLAHLLTLLRHHVYGQKHS